MEPDDELRAIADELDALVAHVAKAEAEYPAEVLEVATSGTVYLKVSFGFGVSSNIWVDLYGLQLKESPEAVEALKTLVSQGVIAREMRIGGDSFQVVLFRGDTLVNINSKLVKRGWATKAVP
jgi:hypothetical protein